MSARPFDLTGPLPEGVTVLEASAGTGKTYTIAALAARCVAEGTPLERLLLVTFTRMATGELRERVRDRLVSAEQGLARVLAGAAPDPGDELVGLLAREHVAERRERLARALADFDAATIATTHGFCQEVLGGLGVAGDIERDGVFVEDVSELLDEVVDDLYVRRFRRGDPQFNRAEAMRIAKAAVENPVARIEPRSAPETTIAAMRVRLADAVRDELDTRKRRMGVMTYDDLLTRLDEILAGDQGEAAAASLRQRYSVVLVDEFQDTDPVQWRIMRTAFAHPGTTLVLIGDPKQAIYAFRGADVFAYLDAAAEAGTRATLEVNRRSDQGLLDAYDAVFGGAQLGHPGIVYRRVRAAPENVEPRLRDAPVAVPLRLRVVPRGDPAVGTTRNGYALLNPSRAFVARDLAADVVRLLSSGARIEDEPVRPGHVAVLTRTHRCAAAARDALAAAGVPAVVSGAGSVFATAPARDWLRLLEAIERPASTPRARSAALTPFLGWRTEQVATADDDAWEEVHRRLHAWARIVRLRGMAALTETVTLAEGLPGRVLESADGERSLTDLRHVAQLLHAAATSEGMGIAALTAWLRQRIAAAALETGDEERSRRLESDAEAVQVLTIHRSKGLEFGVVYYPDLWEPGNVGREGEPVVFHDPAAGGERTIDVGLDGPDWTAHRALHVGEQRGEDLRLAYVALTRAKHQAVVWWAGTWQGRHSALGRLVFARGDDGTVPADSPFGPPLDAAAITRFEALAATAPGCVAVERAQLELPAAWSPPPRDGAALAVADFDRSLDLRWRRTSYSDMTAAAHEASAAPVASEPEQAGVTDEPPVTAPLPSRPSDDDAADAALRTVGVPLAEMPAGVQIGTFVHGVLEAADFAADDLDAELTARVEEAQAWSSLELGDPAVVVSGLRAFLQTPLGPLVGGLRLCDLARRDRLDELGFELPLSGGDAPRGRVDPAAIGALLRAHLPAGDPLAGYADRLDDPALRQGVRGYLTGSIDLVLRLPDGRYALADYKTNWLAAPGEALSAWHHRPAALGGEMERAHYGLQALLYTVALHRYLRWRVPDHDPERDLAGVLYLFLRGMTGAETPTVGGLPCGVFAWRPPGALVLALSDLLDGPSSPEARPS